MVADGCRVATVAILDEGLQVLVLLNEAAHDDVDNDVGLTDIDQHIVFESYGRLLPDKDAIADSKILYHVLPALEVVLDLKVATPVLLCSLLVLVRDNEIVHNVFLDETEGREVKRKEKTYDSGLLLVEVALMLLDTLLATEEDEAITQVVFIVSTTAAASWDVIVTGCIGGNLVSELIHHTRVRPLRLMRKQAKSVDVNFFAFYQGRRALNGQLKDGCFVGDGLLQPLPMLLPLGVLPHR